MTTTFHKKDQPLQQTNIHNVDIALLAAGDGTEIIRHHLNEGAYWSLMPEEGWDALEYVYVLKGRIRCTSPEEYILEPGDSVSCCPVTYHMVFHAETEAEFLYITSQPQYHQYSVKTGTLRKLAVSVEEKDGYTADHCDRILQVSMKIAKEMKVPTRLQMDLQMGSFLHDVGKVKVPDEILNKPGKLTPEEWQIMKRHPIHGAEMIRDTGMTAMDGAARITEQHHERYDGSGYPYGLKGDEIHIGAAIVAVADSYDAMTSDRIYRKARPKSDAVAEIVSLRGKLYHPDVVDAFVRLVEKGEV